MEQWVNWLIITISAIYVLRMIKLCVKNSVKHSRALIIFNPWNTLKENVLSPLHRSDHGLGKSSTTWPSGCAALAPLCLESLSGLCFNYPNVWFYLFMKFQVISPIYMHFLRMRLHLGFEILFTQFYIFDCLNWIDISAKCKHTWYFIMT